MLHNAGRSIELADSCECMTVNMVECLLHTPARQWCSNQSCSPQLQTWKHVLLQHQVGSRLLTCEHMVCRLKYDEGEDEESIEWVDFRELTVDEIKQHPAYPVVQRPPAAPRPTPSVPSPAPRPHEASTTGRNAGAEQVGHLCSLSKGWHSKPDEHMGTS